MIEPIQAKSVRITFFWFKGFFLGKRKSVALDGTEETVERSIRIKSTCLEKAKETLTDIFKKTYSDCTDVIVNVKGELTNRQMAINWWRFLTPEEKDTILVGWRELKENGHTLNKDIIGGTGKIIESIFNYNIKIS